MNHEVNFTCFHRTIKGMNDRINLFLLCIQANLTVVVLPGHCYLLERQASFLFGRQNKKFITDLEVLDYLILYIWDSDIICAFIELCPPCPMLSHFWPSICPLFSLLVQWCLGHDGVRFMVVLYFIIWALRKHSYNIPNMKI